MIADDEPAYVVEPVELAAVDPDLGRMRAIPGSRMFEIRDGLAAFRRDNPGSETFDASQGDGGASLPGVPPELLEEALRMHLERGTSYDKPGGTDEFRRVVSQDYWQLEAATGWGPENVVACQGGRDALLKAYDAIQLLGHGRRGDFLVVSRVPWISYNWGPYLLGANVCLAPGDPGQGWRLTAEGLGACVRDAERQGRKVAALVVTSPDNPTGRSLGLDDQLGLARAAFEHGVPFVLFDWIYHRLSEGGGTDLNRFLLALTPEERDRCLFLDGITKSLGASNVRNAHLVASRAVCGLIQQRASHGVIPSYFSQAVAVAAIRRGFEVASASLAEPIAASRRWLRTFLEAEGVPHVLGDGYYAFVDVGQWMDRAGFEDAAAVGACLAERFGVAVVPGSYFSRFATRWLRVSYALTPEVTERTVRRLLQSLRELDEPLARRYADRP